MPQYPSVTLVKQVSQQVQRRAMLQQPVLQVGLTLSALLVRCAVLFRKYLMAMFLITQSLFYGLFYLLPINQHYPFLIFDACRRPTKWLTLPLWAWGLFLILYAAMYLRGLVKYNRRLVRAACAMGAFYWAFVGIVLFLKMPNIPTGSWSLLMMFLYGESGQQCVASFPVTQESASVIPG